MGHVNVIWQGDANAQVLRCSRHCTTPTTPINVTGPETISIRWLAGELAARLGIDGADRRPGSADRARSPTRRAATRAVRLPAACRSVAMLDWVADWVRRGGASFAKPTKFEVRDGELLKRCAIERLGARRCRRRLWRCSDAAGWNQTADDWASLHRRAADGRVRDRRPAR